MNKNGMYFLDYNYIASTILATKSIHFDESFATLEECKNVSSFFTERLKKLDYNIHVLDKIDSYYFIVLEDKIYINTKNNISLDILRKKYNSFSTCYEIMDEIWNDNLVFEYLNEMYNGKKKLI